MIVVLIALAITSAWQLGTARAEGPVDYDVPNGHFFTQTNGSSTTAAGTGYVVMNDDAAPFWNEFRRLGGVGGLGYPVSRRFVWDGFATQAFQRGVLQWHPEVSQAWLVNVFDLLHNTGKDAWLASVRATPLPLGADFDAGKVGASLAANRQALLNANEPIKKQYFAVSDPLTFYGLPTSRILDNGNHYSIRLQRAVIQQWKVDVPWAKSGQVTVANGGDIAKESGLLPADALTVELPASGAGRVVAIDAGHGGQEIGAAYRFPDGTTLLEKDLNLRVALKVADLLARAGYKPVLTRKTDTQVNNPPKLLTGHPPIGLDDDLQARVDIANNAGAQLFLSIHFNGHPDSKLRGPEIYYCKDRPFGVQSRRFADLLLADLMQGLANIGYKDDDAAVKDDSQALKPGEHFYLLGPSNDIIVRPSAMPAALAEGLFVTNSGDASDLRGERTLDAIARAYALAVHQYFAGPGAAQVPLPLATPAPPTAVPQPTATRTPTPLPPTPTKPTPIPAPAIGQGIVTADFGGGALLRAQPATSAAIIRALPDGSTVDILEAIKGEAVLADDTRWYRARYDGSEGYVYGQLLRIAVPLTPPSLGQGTVNTDSASGALLRSAPAPSASVLRPLPEGAVLSLVQLVNGGAVLSGDSRWYRARYEGDEGYVYAALVNRS